jgi:NADH-quinone oxidoreductase subunit F
VDLGEQMTGKTICVLSDSCAAAVTSAIQKFRPDFEAYVRGGRAVAV